MKNNDYSVENYVNYNDFFNKLDESFFNAHRFYSKDYCECIDGLYLTRNFKLVEYYARMVKDCNCPYTAQLVYTSSNRLTAGFGKEVILT